MADKNIFDHTNHLFDNAANINMYSATDMIASKRALQAESFRGRS